MGKARTAGKPDRRRRRAQPSTSASAPGGLPSPGPGPRVGAPRTLRLRRDRPFRLPSDGRFLAATSACRPVGFLRMAAPRDDGALLIMGGGRMGGALLSALLAAGRPAAELVVAEVSPSRRKELAAAHRGVAVVDAPVPVAAAVLAVKPGDVAGAARAVADAGCERVLSVAAGVTTKAIEAAVSGRLRVGRAMSPRRWRSRPCLVRRGCSSTVATLPRRCGRRSPLPAEPAPPGSANSNGAASEPRSSTPWWRQLNVRARSGADMRACIVV